MSVIPADQSQSTRQVKNVADYQVTVGYVENNAKHVSK
jgi:hypothetical protein